jgi:hypothetical protein
MDDPRVVTLLNAISLGNSRTDAAAFAGIHRDTLYDWLQNPTFSDALEKAEAEAKVRAVSHIIRAAQGGTWQAAAWWLERRYPKEFGRREQVDVQLDVQKMAERLAAESGLEPAAILAEAERLARLASG